MKALVFAGRNIKEILRDPMSYVFCLGFPIIMLVVFYGVFYSEEAYWFSLETLTPGIAVFSLSFSMLFMALLVSKDRATSFLSRLYVSPMKTSDYILGYSIPGIAIAAGQVVACYLTAAIIGYIVGTPLNLVGSILAIISTVPAMIMFVGFGILLGSVFSDKAAPGVCSILITLSGFLSGAWMRIDPGTALNTVASVFPFHPAVSISRVALSTSGVTFANFEGYLVTVCLYAGVVVILSVAAFRVKMRSDNT
ncbi:MAG: ABC transporter permease [Candidatus Bathyarchaeia archaeon]